MAKKAKKEEEGAAGEEAPKSKKKLFIIIGGVVLLAAAGGGGWFFLKKPSPEQIAAAEAAAKAKTEADLRGILSNDSMTEDEKRQYQKEQELAAEAAKLRDEDYQLAYAVDILRGAAAITVQPEE